MDSLGLVARIDLLRNYLGRPSLGQGLSLLLCLLSHPHHYNSPTYTMGKTRLATPKTFQLAYNSKWRLVTIKFDERSDMIKALARAACHYEKGNLTRIKASFVGINMSWLHFNLWIDSLIQLEEGGKRTGPTPEEWLLISHLINIDQISYITAYIHGDDDTLVHELAHATFYLDCQYKTQVVDVWNEIKQPHKDIVEKCLKDWGYHSDNWLDEWQAYSVENPSVWSDKRNKDIVKEMQMVQTKLRKKVDSMVKSICYN